MEVKKIVWLVLIVLSCSLAVRAQSVNEAQVKADISQAAAALQSLQCDFVQTKHVSLLNDQLVSRGVMYYQQGNKLHWEYTSPYAYTFVLNGSQVVLRNRQRSDVIDVKQNKLFREIVKIMMNSVVGKCLTDDKDFSVSIRVTPSEYQAEMVPLRKDLKPLFQTIVLHFDRRKKLVTQVELIEKKGDKTLIQLSNMKTNVPIAESLFAIR